MRTLKKTGVECGWCKQGIGFDKPSLLGSSGFRRGQTQPGQKFPRCNRLGLYIYIPRTQLTSIFEGTQPSKTRPKFQSKQGAPFGLIRYIYITGVRSYKKVKKLQPGRKYRSWKVRCFFEKIEAKSQVFYHPKNPSTPKRWKHL